MKWIVAVIFCIFLVGCAEELPPSPPAPGEANVGRAAGMVIPSSALPSWAAELKYTDIEPSMVKAGDVVKVAVTKPSSVKTKFYVHAIAYAYNKKFGFWEKALAESSSSGKITKSWAEDKATFSVPVSTERFTTGANYIVTYWCIDTDKRDDKGFKIWDCNGKKWGLGAFEMISGQYPDVLIESNIGSNVYKNSVKSAEAWGTSYTATYDHSGVKTEVKAVKLSSVGSVKTELSGKLAILEPKWITKGVICGFLEPGTGFVTYSWLSGGYWLSVKTFAITVDDAKIAAYGVPYPSDCGLLAALKAMIPVPCGNGVLDVGEQCDKDSDSACPGACRPNCTCYPIANASTGFCGDGKVEIPNSAGFKEQCEPPGTRDPVTGQLISTACFTRNNLSKVTGTGGCDENCLCANVSFTLAGPKVCGDLKIDSPNDLGVIEKCDPPGAMALNCSTIILGNGSCGYPPCANNCTCPIGTPCSPPPPPIPLCGNNVTDAGEDCDPPGALICPNITLINGTCGPPPCTSNCTCPVGNCNATAPQDYVWMEDICNFWGCPPMCTGEIECMVCTPPVAPCTVIPATPSTFGKILACKPRTADCPPPGGSPGGTGTTGGAGGYTIVPGTRGCRAEGGCYKYGTGTSEGTACSGTYGGCSVTYACAISGELLESHSPPGCTSSFSMGTGGAIVDYDVADVSSSKSVQLGLFLVAALGILFVTLANFMHRE